jgi:hypothetical protein
MNTTKNVLNLILFNRIKNTFKNVRIGNTGQKQLRKKTRDIITGRDVVKIDNWGEHYAVCCPFCNDTRFRCLISHRYGTLDEFGKKQTRLVVCFNAGCPLALKQTEVYEKLEQMLTGHKLYDLTKVSVKEGREVDVDAVRMNWPGDVVRVDKLPENHPAVVYLKSRHFEPEHLGKFYNVHWCTKSAKVLCNEKLIVPIYHNKKMVGWQARAAYETNWKLSNIPKYFTAPGTPKRNIIYNFGNMLKCNMAVIVEGVTSVWRGGNHFGAVLGSSIFSPQIAMIAKNFHSCILLFDPDVKEKAENEKKLKSLFEAEAELDGLLAGGCCSVWLPTGTDPAIFTDVQFLKDYITEEAKKKDVITDWGKKDG